MSKVYSFRLSNDNPREAQAREVIEAWVAEGYSLRHVLVEALFAYKKDEVELDDLHSILKQMNELIASVDNHPVHNLSEASLSNSFMASVKQAARLGLSSE
jgi:hypothetical protein